MLGIVEIIPDGPIPARTNQLVSTCSISKLFCYVTVVFQNPPSSLFTNLCYLQGSPAFALAIPFLIAGLMCLRCMHGEPGTCKTTFYTLTLRLGVL